ncbi:MAG: DUF58 domain-containing protein [Burkholderiaceae bacterium]
MSTPGRQLTGTVPGPLGKRRAAARRTPAGSRFERLIARFLPRGKPTAEGHRLTVRNIYVLPTREGLMLGLVMLVMLVCSINYGLALGYALTFLVFGIGLVALLHTYRNLAGLSLRTGRAEPAYAGGAVDIGIQLANGGPLERFAVGIDVPGMSRTDWADVSADGEQTVRIALAAPKRGWQPMPKLTFATRYPLGIWRAWSYWQPMRSVLVYPQPETASPPLPCTVDESGEGQGRGRDDEDLAGVRPFRPGDSPHRAAWTAMARTASDELLAKHFEGANAGELQLDFDGLPSQLDTEARLSRLTRWVLEAERREIRYGLRLQSQTIAAGNGSGHMQQCLEALALFGTATDLRPQRMEAR